MGLDTTHDCWHGAYSSFTRWRTAVSLAAGYYVQDDAGYPSVVIDWDAFEAKNYQGEWDQLPEDPLLILIVHSDCDGHITPEAAPWLADRLEQILPRVADSGDGRSLRSDTERFIKGLRDAAAAGEKVEFW
jgi:hypothetical protein